MEVSVPAKFEKELEKISGLMGIKKNDLVRNALYFYVSLLEKEVNIREEFRAWDMLSDEALRKFEESL